MNKGDLIYLIDTKENKLVYININKVVSIDVFTKNNSETITPKVIYRFHMIDNSVISYTFEKDSDDESDELAAQLGKFWMPAHPEFQNKFDF